jgi:hypothetical protein
MFLQSKTRQGCSPFSEKWGLRLFPDENFMNENGAFCTATSPSSGAEDSWVAEPTGKGGSGVDDLELCGLSEPSDTETL